MKIPTEKDWGVLIQALRTRFPNGAAIGLSGTLGAGKTAFVRTFIHAVAAENGLSAPRVVSPTFVFRQPYPELRPYVEHFDLYRLENIALPTLQELGVEDAIEKARQESGFVFIEWPERIQSGVLALDLVLRIEISGDGRVVKGL